MKTVLKYPGSKIKIADWICRYIPPHETYLELFFGGGAVFFNKEPTRIETINDLSGEVVNYFKILRDHPKASEAQINTKTDLGAELKNRLHSLQSIGIKFPKY